MTLVTLMQTSFVRLTGAMSIITKHAHGYQSQSEEPISRISTSTPVIQEVLATSRTTDDPGTSFNILGIFGRSLILNLGPWAEMISKVLGRRHSHEGFG